MTLKWRQGRTLTLLLTSWIASFQFCGTPFCCARAAVVPNARALERVMTGRAAAARSGSRRRAAVIVLVACWLDEWKDELAAWRFLYSLNWCADWEVNLAGVCRSEVGEGPRMRANEIRSPMAWTAAWRHCSDGSTQGPEQAWSCMAARHADRLLERVQITKAPRKSY